MRSSVRARSSASRIVSAPAFGLPSASPPIQVPKRSGGRRLGQVAPVVGEEPFGCVDQALLEEPVAVADLVDNARTPRPDLIRLPERRDLGGELVLDLLAAKRCELRVVELGEQRRDSQVRSEDGAARRLGRMRREHELERYAALDLLGGDVSSRLNGVGKRLRHDSLLDRVGAPAADPVLLLGDVREREVERERAQDARLPLERQPDDGGREVVVRGTGARGAGERPNALDVVEERLVLLLDEHPAEQVAEHADVAPERGVGGGVLDGHPASVGRNVGKTGQRGARRQGRC